MPIVRLARRAGVAQGGTCSTRQKVNARITFIVDERVKAR